MDTATKNMLNLATEQGPACDFDLCGEDWAEEAAQQVEVAWNWDAYDRYEVETKLLTAEVLDESIPIEGKAIVRYTSPHGDSYDIPVRFFLVNAKNIRRRHFATYAVEVL